MNGLLRAASSEARSVGDPPRVSVRDHHRIVIVQLRATPLPNGGLIPAPID